MAVYGGFLLDMTRRWLHGRDVRVALLANYIQSPTDDMLSHVVAKQISGFGYPSENRSVNLYPVLDNAIPGVWLACDDIQFGQLGAEEVNAIVFYDHTGQASTSRLLVADVFPAVPLSGKSFTYTTNGYLTLLGIEAETEITP